MQQIIRRIRTFFESSPKTVSLIPEDREENVLEPTPPLALDEDFTDNEEVQFAKALEPSSPGMGMSPLIAFKVQSLEMSRLFDCPREALQLTLACVPKERMTEARVGLAYLLDPSICVMPMPTNLREACDLVDLLPTELLPEAQSLLEGLFDDKGRVRKIALALPTPEENALGDSKSAMRRSCREVDTPDKSMFTKPVMIVRLVC